MDRPGPSGISPSTIPGRKRPAEDRTTGQPKAKRAKKTAPEARGATRGKGKRPVRQAVTRKAAKATAAGSPAVQGRLEDIFGHIDSDSLKEAVRKNVKMCQQKNETLARAASRLNGKFKTDSTAPCNTATLFEYVERQKLLEGPGLYGLMPLEVAMARAKNDPAVLDPFLLAWWESGRSFKGVYSEANQARLSVNNLPEGGAWHPQDLIEVSPLLKAKLQQPDEGELDRLYRESLQKKVNETGRLLLYAHLDDRAMELYFKGKLGAGGGLNHILAILRNARVPARICENGKWELGEVYRWLWLKADPGSDLHNLLSSEELPFSALSYSTATDPGHDFLLASVIKNWVRKHTTLSNIIKNLSSSSIMLPEWAKAWDSKCIARLIVDHFGIMGFFPTSLEELSAQYKSDISQGRRNQLGIELLVRVCAQEPGALSAYIHCRLDMREQYREDDPDRKKIDCEQVAAKLNQQGIPCPLSQEGKWIGVLVDSYAQQY